ncbi:MAG: nickel pincer cofactor biosynthesis protein LarB [Myxococcota bacterium]
MSRRDLNLDLRRRERLGFDEAILCQPKSVRQLAAILERADEAGATLLLTRLLAEQMAALPDGLRALIDYEAESRTGYFGRPAPLREEARIAVLTAGTSDAPTAREAVRTLGYYGEPSLEVSDVGVAGLWRLLERIDEIRKLPVVIAVSGMDGALSSVVAGLVPGLVVSVPTSTGYGVAAGGETALRSALTSCAPGVVVVNIDNGYGAACAALRSLPKRA